MVFPLRCCVMVAPELQQQRYILSFVFASNLSLYRLYITMCLTLRTIRAKRPHHSCGASTRYVRSINTPIKNPHKKISVIPFRIPQILNIIDNSNVSELVCVWSCLPKTYRSTHNEVNFKSRIIFCALGYITSCWNVYIKIVLEETTSLVSALRTHESNRLFR